MKKKEIEKIPWMAGSSKGMNVVARVVDTKGEKILLVDVSRQKPVVRICLTKKEFMNYFPSTETTGKKWNRKMIDNLHLESDRLSPVFPTEEENDYGCLTGAYRTLEYKENYKTIISKESKNAISRYTGNQSTWIRAIQQYQHNIAFDESIRKTERRFKRCDERMKTVPDIPKGFDRWVKKCAKGSMMSILPFARKKTTEGICSSCGLTTEYERGQIKPGQNVTCPHCKARAKVRRLDWKNKNPLPEKNITEPVLIFQKTTEGYVQRHFIVNRSVRTGEEKVTYLEVGRIFRINCKTYTYFLKCGWDSYYWDDKNLPGMNNIRLLNGRVYTGNITGKMFSGTKYQYAAFDFMYHEEKFVPIEWLVKYEKFPQIEMMAKMGLRKLALQIQTDDLVHGARKPWEMFGIEKGQLNRMCRINGGIKELTWLQYENQRRRHIEDDVMIWFSKNDISPDNIKFISDRMTAERVCNYLKKQSTMSGRAPKEILGTWEDYLNMAERMKMNTVEELFFKPKDLIKNHDDAVKMCGGVDVTKRANEIIRKFPDVDSVCQSLADKYQFSDTKYSIVTPKKIEDIILEGRSLGHCLDRSDIYFDRIQRRESYIVFLRKSEEPDKPYYTLEIEPDGTTRQKRTTGDKQNKDFQDALSFIRKWQAEIQKRLSEQDRKLAETSVFLRNKEFIELRKNKTKIWHGNLAGKLLVDVLKADLMEIEAK